MHVPRWAFHLFVGFFYLSVLCGVLTIVTIVGMMVYISNNTDQIRKTQVKNAKRIESVVEEVARGGDLKSLPDAPPNE